MLLQKHLLQKLKSKFKLIHLLMEASAIRVGSEKLCVTREWGQVWAGKCFSEFQHNLDSQLNLHFEFFYKYSNNIHSTHLMFLTLFFFLNKKFVLREGMETETKSQKHVWRWQIFRLVVHNHFLGHRALWGCDKSYRPSPTKRCTYAQTLKILHIILGGFSDPFEAHLGPLG